MIRLLLIICLAAASITGARAQETRIAAVVNDDIVSLADLEARLRLVFASSNLEDSPQARQRIAGQVLRGLIDEKLEMQEARRLNIKVTDNELKDAIHKIETQNRLPPGGLEAYMKQRGIPLATLTDQLTATIAWAKVVRRRLTQSVTVSEEEIDEAMAQLKGNEGQPLNRVAEIFLAVDDPQQEEEVRRLAERLFDQLRQGANFPAIAQQFSQSATAAVGGDIGWVAGNQLAPELAKVVERMNPRDLSPPVRASGGYYILYLLDRRVPTRSGSPGEATVQLVQVMFPVATPADRERATAAAKSVSETAKSCGEMLKIGRDQAPQTSGDLGRLRVADLPPELQQTVLTLPIAQPSQPLPLRGGIGVLMVCGRDTPPSSLPSRDEVADMLSRQRMDNLARRYLRDLRRTAFVDVRV